MSILNNIEEISTFIVCPHCKHNSKKDWIAYDMECIVDNRSISKKSRIYFRCISCNRVQEVLDSKLIKFIYKEIITRDGYYKCDNG